jgi:hypothetical protein
VEIRYQCKGFITTEIFEHWLVDTFIPEINKRREAYQYSGDVFLIYDNCIAHSSDVIDELLLDHRIIPLPLPPHSSSQLQPLDLSLFGITKRLISRANKLESHNVQTEHVCKVLSSFYSASTPLNIIKSFKSAGIGVYFENGFLMTRIDRNTARCIIASSIDRNDEAEQLEKISEEETIDNDENVPIYIQEFIRFVQRENE